MTPQMGLFFSAIAFVGLHFLMSHPLRAPLIRVMGVGPFRGLYSLISLFTFGLMIYFYRAIGREPPLWDSGEAGGIAGTVLMLLASIFFFGSFFGNPALLGGPGASRGPPGGPSNTRPP